MRAGALGVAAVLAVVSGAGRAAGGVHDTALPTFSDGQAAQLVAVLPTATKDNAIETAVICTNLASGAVDIGLEVFDETGALRNAVSTGDGAILAVGAGRTVTLATGTIAVLQVDGVVTLNGAGSGANNLRNGSARVVATSTTVGCVALAVDRLHTIEDPATCPTCQPPSLTTLPFQGQTAVVPPCLPSACDDGDPCTVDGCSAAGQCVHTAASDGTGCDDHNPCTTDDACMLGVCVGTAVVCGGDTPCNISAVCDAVTGQCVATTPFSSCVGGGGKQSTDCAAEWVVENPNNRKGPTSSRQICPQGDKRCDFDINSGQCTFRVRVCLNNHDLNLPSCTPGALSAYELKSPSPRSPAGQALLAAIVALAPSSRSGKRGNVVTFGPPDASTSDCTPPVPVGVRLGRAMVVRVRATSSNGRRDKDTLRLKCVRRRR